MKTCTFYKTTPNGPIVRGVVTLDNNTISVSPDDQFMHGIAEEPCIVGSNRYISAFQPSQWFDALPLCYRGSYLYAVREDLQSIATKFNPNHDPHSGEFTPEFYHGTSEKVAKQILKQGLKPKSSVGGAPKIAYATRDRGEAFIYARSRARTNPNQIAGIVVIDPKMAGMEPDWEWGKSHVVSNTLVPPEAIKRIELYHLNDLEPDKADDPHPFKVLTHKQDGQDIYAIVLFGPKLANILKFNPNHDDKGRFSVGDRVAYKDSLIGDNRAGVIVDSAEDDEGNKMHVVIAENHPLLPKIKAVLKNNPGFALPSLLGKDNFSAEEGRVLSHVLEFKGEDDLNHLKPGEIPKNSAAQLAKDLVVYHGTVKENLKSILKNGLVAGHPGGGDEWAKNNRDSGELDVTDESFKAMLARKPSVFMTKNLEVANYFTGIAKKIHPGADPLILKLKIPHSVLKDFKPDEQTPMDSPNYRYEGNIPPAWIVGELDPSTHGKFVPVHASKEETHDMYVVLLCEKATEKRDILRAIKFNQNHDVIGRFATSSAGPTQPNDDNYIKLGAQAYAKGAGLPDLGPRMYVNPDVRGPQIADAYEKAQHSPDNPRVAESYIHLKKEITAQWDYATKQMGVNFEPWRKDGQPYKNSDEMRQDVLNNKHLYFFTGGTIPADHPLAQRDASTGYTYNDKLRAVHDLFGHAMGGFQFGPRGEENAWLEHSKMFSKEAIPALTAETKGQNSWVNQNSQIREAAAAGHPISAEDRPFADQKATLLPGRYTDRKVKEPEFIGSPNTSDNMSLEAAVHQMSSADISRYMSAAKSLDKELGFEEASHQVGLGLWEGGAEATVIERAKGRVDPDTIRAAAALMGKTSGDLSGGSKQQNAMMTWFNDPKGPHTMYEVTVPKVSLPEVEGRLKKAGVQFSTAIPDGEDITVMMVHETPADKEVADIAKAIGGVKVKDTHGYVEFIKKDNYDKIINDYSKNHPLPKAASERIHHHALEWPYPHKVEDILNSVVI